MRTRVGYAGGATKNPTYEDLADHTEAIAIDFDPKAIGYDELLRIFFGSHNACATAYSRQYRSVIFFSDEAQAAAASTARASFEAVAGGKAKTAIEKLDVFWRAEDYHQKFYLRQVTSVATELRSLFADERSFVDSTAVARLNGFAGGNGTKDDLRRDLPLSGLSTETQVGLAKRLGIGDTK